MEVAYLYEVVYLGLDVIGSYCLCFALLEQVFLLLDQIALPLVQSRRCSACGDAGRRRSTYRCRSASSKLKRLSIS